MYKSENIISKIERRSIINKKNKIREQKEKIYKLFYEIKEEENPNKGYICLIKNIFRKITGKKIYIYSTLESPIKIKKIIYSNKKTEDIIYEGKKTIEFNNYIKKFIEYIKRLIEINFNYSNLYLSEDETILYYIEDNNINNFDILNIYLLDTLNKLPSIVFSYNNSIIFEDNLEDNTINLSPVIEESSNKTYTTLFDVQIIKFINSDIIIENYIENSVITLEGEIKNWYYILTTLKEGESLHLPNKVDINHLKKVKNIVQFVYITDEEIRKYNQYFSYYKMPLSIHKKTSVKVSLYDCVKREEKRKIYKLFYEIKEEENPNKGYICLIKDLFKKGKKSKHLYTHLKSQNKFNNIIYCSLEDNEVRFKERNSIIFQKYLDKLIYNLFYSRNLDITDDNSYNKLYISEDETILYYIENDYIDNFIIINNDLLFLEYLPFIQYSSKLSDKYNSDYYTIYLNNNLLLPESGLVINDNGTSTFNKKGELIILSDDMKKFYINPKITVKLDTKNLYFVQTKLKIGKSIVYPNLLDINELKDGNEIIQFVRITDDKIKYYNDLLLSLKIPINIEIINSITSPKQTAKQTPKETAKQTPKETPKETLKQTAKQTPKQTPKENKDNK